MEESKRQKQVGKLIQVELSDIFLREGLNMINGGMVSIASVKVTPDLFEARVYLSMFQVKESEVILKKIKEQDWQIRKLLAARIRHQMRKMPTLSYYIDDTLDYVFKMEEVFKNLDIPKEEE
jgi:ribosome-binding factor A